MSKKRSLKRIILRTSVALISLPILLLLVAVIFLMSKPKLDADLREEIGGQYITLSKGVTHYELVQPDDSAPLIVLIPGLTVPKAVYMNNVEALQKAGYATLRYDFYGRGLSDRPLMKYNSKVYAAQTKELLDSLKIQKPVHLLGISLGAAIGAEIIADEPERYKSITFIGAAVAFSKADADAKKRAVLMDRLKVFKKNDFVDTTLDAYKFIPYIKEQFNYRGAELAFISLAMNESVFDYLASYKELTSVKRIPMQIIWGELDDNFPYPLGVRLGKMFPDAEFHTIPGGGHTPHFGQAELVNPMMVNFLDRVEGRNVDVAGEGTTENFSTLQ